MRLAAYGSLAAWVSKDPDLGLSLTTGVGMRELIARGEWRVGGKQRLRGGFWSVVGSKNQRERLSHSRLFQGVSVLSVGSVESDSE